MTITRLEKPTFLELYLPLCSTFKQVEMENMVNKERYTFNCKRWLARDEDDGAIVREMPAEGSGIKTPLPCKSMKHFC